MIVRLLIFLKQGETSGVYTVRPSPDPLTVEDWQERKEKIIIEALRHDWEERTYGGGIPEKNPSEDPDRIELFYTPVRQKQALYKGLPAKMDSYQIIDAFTCLGSRFDLKGLSVFVEICRSDMGGARYWANIYYVADSEIPACIIKVEEWSFFLEDEEVRAMLEWNDAERERLEALAE